VVGCLEERKTARRDSCDPRSQNRDLGHPLILDSSLFLLLTVLEQDI
jgi:hypothetical protein